MGLMYTSIRVKDMKKSLAFYSKYLGLKVIGRREPIPDELVVSLEDKSTKQTLYMILINLLKFNPHNIERLPFCLWIRFR